MIYSIDTSALIDGRRRYYPPDVFPTVWQRIDQLITRGEVIGTEEVFVELKKQDDEVYEWAEQRRTIFVPVDESIQHAVIAILQQYPRLVDTRRNRSNADPFVIALAQIRGCTVVTGEKPTGKLEKPNIPDVCSALAIDCLDLLGVFRQQGWQV